MSTLRMELEQFLDDVPRGESGCYEFLPALTAKTMPAAAVSKKVWTICRRFSELRLPRHLTLVQWAERDRLLSGDFVFDHDLNTWVCARELGELKAFFRGRKAARALQLIWLSLGIAAATVVVAPMSAGLFVAAAAALFIRRHRLQRSLEQGASVS